jgi:hypothetical protein
VALDGFSQGLTCGLYGDKTPRLQIRAERCSVRTGTLWGWGSPRGEPQQAPIFLGLLPGPPGSG